MADVKIEISVNSGGRPFILVLELEEALELKDKLNVMFPNQQFSQPKDSGEPDSGEPAVVRGPYNIRRGK